jgi:hypothetical protein
LGVLPALRSALPCFVHWFWSDCLPTLFPASLSLIELNGLSAVLKQEGDDGFQHGGITPQAFAARTEQHRAAARAAKLPDNLTLAAYRHCGITELGDAELTEQGVMAMTGA